MLRNIHAMGNRLQRYHLIIIYKYIYVPTLLLKYNTIIFRVLQLGPTRALLQEFFTIASSSWCRSTHIGTIAILFVSIGGNNITVIIQTVFIFFFFVHIYQ